MSIRTIEYTVTVGGILPQNTQRGGVQGDHNATVLRFTLDKTLVTALNAYAAGGKKLYYRFDGYDGAGAMVVYDSSELVFSDDGTAALKFPLENRLTANGGRVTVYLVITATENTGSTELELYSFPALIELAQKPDGVVSEEDIRESLTTLAESAKRSEEGAATSEKNSAAAAKAAKAASEEAAGYAADLSEHNTTPDAHPDIRNALVGKKTAEGGEVFNDYTNNKAKKNAHAEGYNNNANGENSHAGGKNSTAYGSGAFAHGSSAYAGYSNSAVFGWKTSADRNQQFTAGQLNKANPDAMFVIGNGTDENSRNNAFEVMADGSAVVDMQGENEKSVVQKQYVDGKFTDLETALGNINTTLAAVVDVEE